MRSLRPMVSVPLLLCCVLAQGCGKKDEPTYGDKVVGAMREAKASQARGDMQSIALAVTQFVSNQGSIPEAPDMAGLVAALEPTWLQRVPAVDPWGTPYQWSTDGSSWTLRSAGRDTLAGNADDVVMTDGQVTQMPKSFNPAAGP